MRLFDDITRTDRTPRGDLEGQFSFLNRVDQPFWARVRELLESWFARYPAEHSIGIRERFRSDATGQHLAAWWELYLFALFDALNFQVEVEPAIAGSSVPDFRLTKGDVSLLVEAATLSSGLSSEAQAGIEQAIIAAINSAEDPNFFVRLEIDRRGVEQPRVKQITEPLTAWLRGLDPDAISPWNFEVAETSTIEAKGWVLTFTAMPKKPSARGAPGRRLLGMPPMQTGWANDVEKIQGKLEDKRKQHGQPGVPLIIALLCLSPTVDRQDLEEALLGHEVYHFDPLRPDSGVSERRRDGFWMKEDGPRRQRVSGVLVGREFGMHTVGRRWPELWVNPWAEHPVKPSLFDLPLACPREDGTVAYIEPNGTPGQLLGLAPDWPGPERPFEKR